MQERKPVLVVGGTGKTGRRVAERLAARGVPVRIGSRSANPAFDWEDPSGWAAALDGVGAAYITYYPDLAAPGAPEAVRALVGQALAQDVRRLVLLSGRGEEEAQQAEQVLQESGADWTIVRASWFCQNFSEGVVRDGILAGEIALPAGDVGEPFVDADDIADVVVAALTEDGHVGQLYEVTGPRLLTFAEATAEIARASGRPVRYTWVPAEDFATMLAQQGTPADFTELLLYLLTTVLDGRNAYPTDGVQRALGRAPKDFADYARDAAASGAWAG
ncbi:NAD(P)H-binding protein [Inquilinus sp. CA228]|uniref:NAD(P)H-binding protein n=1 Tax=Inquilinus sp. CA228 TaxID=3455609 RepID=UPI003F8D12B7